jgi:hypothetical protein
VILAHVAGIPVEETLPGFLAIGFLGMKVAVYHLGERTNRFFSRRDRDAASESQERPR